MAEKLRAGVMGCGLGAAHAYAYDRSDNFDLVAVCDLKPEVLDALWDRAKLERGSVPTSTHPTAKCSTPTTSTSSASPRPTTCTSTRSATPPTRASAASSAKSPSRRP